MQLFPCPLSCWNAEIIQFLYSRNPSSDAGAHSDQGIAQGDRAVPSCFAPLLSLQKQLVGTTACIQPSLSCAGFWSHPSTDGATVSFLWSVLTLTRWFYGCICSLLVVSFGRRGSFCNNLLLLMTKEAWVPLWLLQYGVRTDWLLCSNRHNWGRKSPAAAPWCCSSPKAVFNSGQCPLPRPAEVWALPPMETWQPHTILIQMVQK